MSYRGALLYGALLGLGLWLAVAATETSTLRSAAPYAAGAGVLTALAACASVAYRSGPSARRWR
jgi:hypothetical protein